MPNPFDAALAAMNAVELATFGEDVIYTSPPAAPVSLQGIPDQTLREDDTQAYRRLWFPAVVGFNPQGGEFMEHSGNSYRIVKAHPDDQGGILVTIEKI